MSIQDISIRKCSCRSVWCQICFYTKYHQTIKPLIEKFSIHTTFNITLTVDPSKFEDGQHAFETIQSKKSIAQLLHNLQRTAGVLLSNHIWFLEFHENNYPHWALIIETEEANKRNELRKIINSYWQHGRIDVKQVSSEEHLENLSTYFDKRKPTSSHQATLPDWALSSNRNIRRWGRMHKKKPPEYIMPDKLSTRFPMRQLLENLFAKLEKQKKRKPIDSSISNQSDLPKIERRTYGEILGSCGKSINVKVFFDEGGARYQTFEIPYRRIRLDFPNGQFESGLGYFPFQDYEAIALLEKFGYPDDFIKFVYGCCEYYS